MPKKHCAIITGLTSGIGPDMAHALVQHDGCWTAT
jgi:NADP-dependent 3-hydroxy acid dehydrogenase YdfG